MASKSTASLLDQVSPKPTLAMMATPTVSDSPVHPPSISPEDEASPRGRQFAHFPLDWMLPLRVVIFALSLTAGLITRHELGAWFLFSWTVLAMAVPLLRSGSKANWAVELGNFYMACGRRVAEGDEDGKKKRRNLVMLLVPLTDLVFGVVCLILGLNFSWWDQDIGMYITLSVLQFIAVPFGIYEAVKGFKKVKVYFFAEQDDPYEYRIRLPGTEDTRSGRATSIAA